MIPNDRTGRRAVDESLRLNPRNETCRRKRHGHDGTVLRKLRRTANLRLPEATDPSLLQHFARNAPINLRFERDIAFLKIGNRTAMCGEAFDKFPWYADNHALAAEIEF